MNSNTSITQCAKLHSDEVSSIVTIRICQDNNTLHLGLFFQRNYSFHYSLIFFGLYLFLKGHNGVLSWCHKITLFSHNWHDHVKILVLLNIFSIRSISLKHNLLFIFIQKRNLSSYFYNVPHFDFQRRGKKLYTVWIKNPRKKNQR